MTFNKLYLESRPKSFNNIKKIDLLLFEDEKKKYIKKQDFEA